MVKKLLSLPPVAFGFAVWDTYGHLGVSRSAAALSYFLILTLFPLLMCVNFFIGLFHLDLEQVLLALEQVLPVGALGIMSDYLSYVAHIQSPALLWASLFTIALSASAGLRTIFLTLDQLFHVHRHNSIWPIVLSVILSFLFLLTIYLSVVVIFTGDWFFWLLESRLPVGLRQLLPLQGLSHLWRWMRYLLLFCFVLLLVMAVYRVGVPTGAVKRPTLRLCALLTSLAMVGCSVVFSWFIGMSSRYALVYGSLASLIILLVWLYICGNILLLGAVLAQVWEQRRPR